MRTPVWRRVWWEPRAGGEQLLEYVQEVHAVFGRGGQVGAQGGEVGQPLQRPPGSGDLQLELGGSKISLALIVAEPDRRSTNVPPSGPHRSPTFDRYLGQISHRLRLPRRTGV